MIKVISDGKTIEASTVEELKTKIGDIFRVDARDDVTLTYVVTTQPASRRMTIPTA